MVNKMILACTSRLLVSVNGPDRLHLPDSILPCVCVWSLNSLFLFHSFFLCVTQNLLPFLTFKPLLYLTHADPKFLFLSIDEQIHFTSSVYLKVLRSFYLFCLA